MDDTHGHTGGCFARVFRSDSLGDVRNYFGHYGPEIFMGDLNSYAHGFRAMKMIEKNLEKMYQTRSSAKDCAEEMGRWLEAAGVTEVYIRPEDSKNEQWLHKGDWRILDIGRFIYEVRQCLTDEVRRIAA